MEIKCNSENLEEANRILRSVSSLLNDAESTIKIANNNLHSKIMVNIKKISIPKVDNEIKKINEIIIEMDKAIEKIINIAKNGIILIDDNTFTLNNYQYQTVERTHADNSLLPSDVNTLLSELKTIFINDQKSDEAVIDLLMVMFTEAYLIGNKEEIVALMKTVLQLKKNYPEFRLLISSDERAHYSFNDKGVYMPYSYIDSYGVGAFIHELGHAFDDLTRDEPNLHSISSSALESAKESLSELVILEDGSYGTKLEKMGEMFYNLERQSEQIAIQKYYDFIYDKYNLTEAELKKIYEDSFKELDLIPNLNSYLSWGLVDNNSDLKAYEKAEEIINELTSYGLNENQITKLFDNINENDFIDSLIWRATKNLTYDEESFKYGIIRTISDTISSIYLGKADIYHWGSHSAEYFEYDPIDLGSAEQIANYTRLRVYGTKEDIKLAKYVFGEEWYNEMDLIYKDFLSYGEDSTEKVTSNTIADWGLDVNKDTGSD